MKVESLKAYPVRVKMKDRLLAGTFRYDDYQTVIVKVSCDGETGWGEAMTRFSPRATALMVEWIGKQISGTEPENPPEAWTTISSQLRVRGQTRGIAVEALSGIETAMWDAFGKLGRRPIGEILGEGESDGSQPMQAPFSGHVAQSPSRWSW